MAIKIVSKPNTDAALFPWPYGKIRDNSGSGDGTPVNTLVYGDFHQFFAVLLQNGSVTANDLVENSSNGFQYNEALNNIPKVQNDFYHIVGNPLQPVFQNSFVTSTLFGSTGAAYKKSDRTNRVYLQGIFQRATEANNTTVWAMPLAYRPIVDVAIPMTMYNNGIFIPGVLRIYSATGIVEAQTNAGDSSTVAYYIIDGLSYSLD